MANFTIAHNAILFERERVKPNQPEVNQTDIIFQVFGLKPVDELLQVDVGADLVG